MMGTIMLRGSASSIWSCGDVNMKVDLEKQRRKLLSNHPDAILANIFTFLAPLLKQFFSLIVHWSVGT
jgi:hypothetical protein